MKFGTLKLCLPIIAMTAQQTAASLVIPPFLDGLHFPIPTIGWLISVAAVSSLAARLPSGMLYRGHRARALMLASLAGMSLCSFLYTFVSTPLAFAFVHGLYGVAYSAATTIYLALFVDSLPPDEQRHHAMGYYAGSLATGYSAGGFAAGYVADKLGYIASFKFSAILGVFCLLVFFLLVRSPARAPQERAKKPPVNQRFFASLQNIWEPNMIAIVVVAMFLNMLHQIGTNFLPLYGLAVGLTLTEVGAIRAMYSLCNAVTRPLSGPVVRRIGHRPVSWAGLPLQSLFMMLTPLFQHFVPLIIVFVLAGFMRAIVIVSNAISVVEDVDEARVSRGLVSGVYNAAQDVGNILGPTVGGLIASFTGVAALFVAAPLLIVAVFLLSLWSCGYVRRSV